jgi:hypothetical protein
MLYERVPQLVTATQLTSDFEVEVQTVDGQVKTFSGTTGCWLLREPKTGKAIDIITDMQFRDGYRPFFEDIEIDTDECCGNGDESCDCPDCSEPEPKCDPEPDDTKREETFDEKMAKLIEELKKTPPYNPTYNPTYPQWPSPSLPYYPIVPYQPYWQDNHFWVGTYPRYLISPIVYKTTTSYTNTDSSIRWK